MFIWAVKYDLTQKYVIGIEPIKGIKGIGGLGQFSFSFCVLSDSETSDCVLSGTFYGIEKARRAVVLYCREVGMYPKILQNLIHFLKFVYFNRKIGQTLSIWLQITLGTPFLAKLFHFMNYPNVTREFG